MAVATKGLVHVDSGGQGDPVLLLLHGMGGTGAVWRDVVDLLPGRLPTSWLAPDLPGHGGSAPLERYTFGAMAAAVAAALDPGRPVVVLGHSLGGAVALELAAGPYGIDVAGVVGLGIKVRWTGEELARAADLAARPGKAFDTRSEALERAAKVAGLAGLVPPHSPALNRLVESSDGWRPTFDPRAMAIGAPDVAGAIARLGGRIPVTLAAGERDPMSPADDLRELVADPVILPGLGHSAHVEDPEAVLALLEHLLR